MRRMYNVDVEVLSRADGSRRKVRLSVLAASQAEARGKAAKFAERVGEGSPRGGFSVREAGTARGGEWT